MKLTFCGDIHTYFHNIDYLIDLEQPDKIIQCGDFGIWPGRYRLISLEHKEIPVYFCRGNHENHDLLDTFPPYQISNLRKNCFGTFPHADNVFFCDTGSILHPKENISILFLGGACSTDVHYRIEGESWWPQEVWSSALADNILHMAHNIVTPDIIVSHTAPLFVVKKLCGSCYPYKYDFVSVCLDAIYAELKPKLWVFGHFHHNYYYNYRGTDFIGLDQCHTQGFDSGFSYSLNI